MANKFVRAVDDVLQDALGNEAKTSEGTPLTLSLALLLTLANLQVGASQSLQVYELVQRLRKIEGNLDVTESEWALLKDALDKNPLKFNAVILAQLYGRFI